MQNAKNEKKCITLWNANKKNWKVNSFFIIFYWKCYVQFSAKIPNLVSELKSGIDSPNDGVSLN